MWYLPWSLSTEMSVTTIDLLRHGETEGEGVYRGQLDYSLTRMGLEHMRAHLKNDLPWQQIITSPLNRCASFAEELSRDTGLSLTYVPGFIEMGFGEWEGKTAEEIQQTDQQRFFAFYEDPIRNTPPQAESLIVFQQRCITAWQDMLQQYQQRHILLVTHAGVIRLLLAHILSMPLEALFHLDVPYACLSRIEVYLDGKNEFARLLFHAGQL